MICFRSIIAPNLVLTYSHIIYSHTIMYFVDREGAYTLCERMLKMGHKRIAYLGSAERPSTKKDLLVSRSVLLVNMVGTDCLGSE